MTSLIAALIAFSFGTFNVQSNANDVESTQETIQLEKGDDGVGMGEVGGGVWAGGPGGRG